MDQQTDKQTVLPTIAPVLIDDDLLSLVGSGGGGSVRTGGIHKVPLSLRS